MQRAPFRPSYTSLSRPAGAVSRLDLRKLALTRVPVIFSVDSARTRYATASDVGRSQSLRSIIHARFPLVSRVKGESLMAASPSTALLGLPPLRPSPSKQPSFGRTASSHNVHHSTASSSSSMMPEGSNTGTSSSHSATQRRARSSSIVSVQEVPETYDDQLDQGALTNVNAEWVNSKGAPFPHSSLEPVESGTRRAPSGSR